MFWPLQTFLHLLQPRSHDIHPLKDIQVVSMSWPLWTVLEDSGSGTLLCMGLCLAPTRSPHLFGFERPHRNQVFVASHPYTRPSALSPAIASPPGWSWLTHPWTTLVPVICSFPVALGKLARTVKVQPSLSHRVALAPAGCLAGTTRNTHVRLWAGESQLTATGRNTAIFIYWPWIPQPCRTYLLVLIVFQWIPQDFLHEIVSSMNADSVTFSFSLQMPHSLPRTPRAVWTEMARAVSLSFRVFLFAAPRGSFVPVIGSRTCLSAECSHHEGVWHYCAQVL